MNNFEQHVLTQLDEIQLAVRFLFFQKLREGQAADMTADQIKSELGGQDTLLNPGKCALDISQTIRKGLEA